MSKYLVIIEAPGKVKKVKSCLSDDYEVVCTKGHIRDLPDKKLGVDVDNNFTPEYVSYDDKKDVIENIINRSKGKDLIYIMTDGDREGEGIGYHVASILPKNTKYKRAITHSITKDAIKKAISEAKGLNNDLVKAYESRRILDRLCGYKTSFLVKRGAGGTSAGRVQSAVLRILAEREKEIQAFVPEEYWPISVELLTKDKKRIFASIKTPDQKDIKNEGDAKKIVDVLKKGPAIVSKFEKKEVATRAQAPFTTSSMYQSASLFGWKSDKTASVAQKLYEAGVITYHRTDATFLVPEFIGSARDLVENDYEKVYLPAKPNYYGSAKGAQEAHEACRVTDLSTKEYTSGDSDEAKLYKMIWKRSLACQMTDMKKLAISADFKVEKYGLGASGSKLIFDGWRKVWDYGEVTDTELPELSVGDELDVLDVKTEQKFTIPPARYNERSLIAKIEKDGIGRPSTYASIPKTLEARHYIENNKNITVTELGMKVIDFMVQVGFCFVEVQFTAQVEEKLDLVAQGKLSEIDLLTEFWTRLKADIKKSGEFKKEKNLSEYDCPDCKAKGFDAKLCLRESRFGKFFSCENYSTKADGCKYKADVGEQGEPQVKVKKEVVTSDKPCPECGTMMVVRHGKSGTDFLGCPKWSTKPGGCKAGLHDMEGNKIEFAAKKSGWKGKKKWTKKAKFSEKDMDG